MALDYSVAIPARNAASFVASALMSVYQQSCPPHEVVVVDDGSDDETASIARDAGARVISLPESVGPSASRNIAVSDTSTSIIAFLDADDEWLPDHAALVLAALVARDVAFAGSDAECFGEGAGVVRTFLPERNPADLRDAFVATNPVIQSSVMVRREAFENAGGYDTGLRLSEDYELWTRVAEHGLYAHVARSTVRRRIHVAQASKRFQAELVRAWWDVRRRVVARRLTAAAAEVAQRERTLKLLESACQTDIDWAIWMGDATLLAIVRDELQATERSLLLEGRLSAFVGLDSAPRRLAQDVRCAGKSLLQSVRRSR